MDEAEKQQKKKDLQLLRETVVKNVAAGRMIKLSRFEPQQEDKLVRTITLLEGDVKRIDEFIKNIDEAKEKGAEQRWLEYELKQLKPDIEKLLAALAKLRNLLEQFEKEEIIRIKDFSAIKRVITFIDERKKLLIELAQNPLDEKKIQALKQNINNALENIKANTQMAQSFENREAVTLLNFLKTETEVQELIDASKKITTDTFTALNQMSSNKTEIFQKATSINTAMNASLEKLKQEIETEKRQIGELAQLLEGQKTKEIELRGEANTQQQHIKMSNTITVQDLDTIVQDLDVIVQNLESGEQAIVGIIGILRTKFGALTSAIQNLEKELQELQNLIEPQKKGFFARIFRRS